MKRKTAELPVAESLKKCIELDEKMQEQWNEAKESLEYEFNRQKGTSLSFTDLEIFKGILERWKTAERTMTQVLYAWSFSNEDIAK